MGSAQEIGGGHTPGLKAFSTTNRKTGTDPGGGRSNGRATNRDLEFSSGTHLSRIYRRKRRRFGVVRTRKKGFVGKLSDGGKK